MARELWISEINYQGTSYVARLNHKPLQQTGASYHMRLPSNVRKVILSVDGIGLRRIQFIDHDSDPVPDGSPWYEVLEVDCPDLKACVNCDVKFSMANKYAKSNSARAFLSATFGLWMGHPLRVESGAHLSFPPKFHLWKFFHLNAKPRLDYVYLDMHIRGLLICSCNSMIIGIHGFSKYWETIQEVCQVNAPTCKNGVSALDLRPVK